MIVVLFLRRNEELKCRKIGSETTLALEGMTNSFASSCHSNLKLLYPLWCLNHNCMNTLSGSSLFLTQHVAILYPKKSNKVYVFELRVVWNKKILINYKMTDGITTTAWT